MKNLLTVTAVLEAGTGLALIALPSLMTTILPGSPSDTPVAWTMSRIAGFAIFALAMACWLARDWHRSAAKGLVAAMMVYNIGIIAVLVYAGTRMGLSATGLWVVVAVHAVMAAWCGLRLTSGR